MSFTTAERLSTINITNITTNATGNSTALTSIPPIAYLIVFGLVLLIVSILILIKIFNKPKPQTESEFIANLQKEWKDRGTNYKAKDMLKVYNICKMKNWLDFKSFKYKMLNAMHPLSTVMVNMELTNGTFAQFVVKADKGYFIFADGCFLIDQDMLTYNNSSKMWMGNWHEELVFPILKKTNIGDLKSSIIKSQEVELESAINPILLNRWMQASVIEKLLKSDMIEDTMRLLKILAIINIVGIVLILLIEMKNLGLLGGK